MLAQQGKGGVNAPKVDIVATLRHRAALEERWRWPPLLLF
jgi:hypothetical protein